MRRALCLLLALLSGSVNAVNAQTFPMRPVTVIVSSAPGVAHDAVMRMPQPRLQERLGQPVIVDNKPGASGQIGTLAVVKARPLAIAGDNRLAELPDVPTTTEAGDPDFKAQFFAAVFAPADVPSQIIVRLNREIAAALKEPETKAKIEAMGLEVVGSSPEDLGRYVADEYKRWSTLARDAHIRFD